MKPKPGHSIRLRVYHYDKVICEYKARTAKELSEKAEITTARIYAVYRRGKRGKLKMCGLTYEIDEVCAEGSEPQKVYKEGDFAKTSYALV